jgi:hypothetical protein
VKVWPRQPAGAVSHLVYEAVAGAGPTDYFIPVRRRQDGPALVTLEVLLGEHSFSNDWIKAGSTALQELLIGLGTIGAAVLIRTTFALREARDDLARMAVAGTVRNDLSSAIQKLEARNRFDAARIAEQKGWL